MTIPIGSMTANFVGSNTVYTAIGMHVTDESSANASKLMHLTVDGESRFTVFKDGGLRISTGTSNPPGNVKLLQISDNGKDVLSVSRDLMIISGNAVFRNNITVGAYAEGYSNVYTTNSVAILDVSKSSVFRLSSSNNHISRFVISGLEAFDGYYSGFSYDWNAVRPAMSITLIMKNGTTIPAGAWRAGGDASAIYWSNGITPITPTGNDVYVLTNTYDLQGYQNIWYGIIAGQDFAIQP